MIPPQTRRKMADTLDATYGWTWSGLQLGGKAAWIISTSILLLGVPFGMALAEEAQAMEIEKEQQQRDLGNEVCGSYSTLHLRPFCKKVVAHFKDMLTGVAIDVYSWRGQVNGWTGCCARAGQGCPLRRMLAIDLVL